MYYIPKFSEIIYRNPVKRKHFMNIKTKQLIRIKANY